MRKHFYACISCFIHFVNECNLGYIKQICDINIYYEYAYQTMGGGAVDKHTSDRHKCYNITDNHSQ